MLFCTKIYQDSIKVFLSKGAIELLEEPQNKITLFFAKRLKTLAHSYQYILCSNVRIPEYHIYHFLSI